VEISNVNEEGAYVQLLEYNNREGLILAASVTAKRNRNVMRLLKMGNQDIMQVTSVDQTGGFIDLTKRNMQREDIEELKANYKKSKVVHLIMKLTAYTLQKCTIDIYESFGWDLYDKFPHAYDALKLCLSDPEIVFSKIDISEAEKEALLKNINKKMAPSPIKLRSRFNL